MAQPKATLESASISLAQWHSDLSLLLRGTHGMWHCLLVFASISTWALCSYRNKFFCLFYAHTVRFQPS